MGILGKIKDVMFVPDEEAPKPEEVVQEPKTKVQRVRAAATSHPQVISSSSVDLAEGDTIVAKILEQLRNDVDERSDAAYVAWLTNVTALQDVVSDQTARFKAALTTAKVGNNNVTLPELIEAIQQRAALVDVEEQEFNGSMDQSVQIEVTARENQIANIDAELEQLAARAAQLSAQKETLESDKLAASSTIETGRARFRTAALALRAEISKELAAVEKLSMPSTPNQPAAK